MGSFVFYLCAKRRGQREVKGCYVPKMEISNVVDSFSEEIGHEFLHCVPIVCVPVRKFIQIELLYFVMDVYR